MLMEKVILVHIRVQFDIYLIPYGPVHVPGCSGQDDCVGEQEHYGVRMLGNLMKYGAVYHCFRLLSF